MLSKILWLVVRKLPIEGVTNVINKRQENKPHCIPAHLNDEEAVHVHEQAYERQWSNSAYMRHLVREDMKRRKTDLYLNGEHAAHSTEQFEFSVRNEKSPVAGTTEPSVR